MYNANIKISEFVISGGVGNTFGYLFIFSVNLKLFGLGM